MLANLFDLHWVGLTNFGALGENFKWTFLFLFLYLNIN